MWDLRTAGSSKKLHIHQIFPSENLDKLQLVLRGWLAGHLEKKVFLRRIGLLLYGVSDPFPLTIPRWRWGMRILQGKGSLPLGNKPRPGGSIKILSWAQVGRWSLKTATTHQRRTWTTTATSVTLIVADHHSGPSGPQSLPWGPVGELCQSFTYFKMPWDVCGIKHKTSCLRR